MRCSNCGTDNSDQARFCNGCGAPLTRAVQQPAPETAPKTSWWQRLSTPGKIGFVSAGFVVFIIVVIAATAGDSSRSSSASTAAQVVTTHTPTTMYTGTTKYGSPPTTKATTTTKAITTTTTAPTTTTSPEAFKESCSTPEYRVLDKDSNDMIGEPMTFRGYALQVMESGGSTMLRLAVEENDWGWDYDTVVFVNYSDEVDVYEEDVVRVWGLCTGEYEYTSTAGWTIQVPSLEALYIEHD